MPTTLTLNRHLSILSCCIIQTIRVVEFQRTIIKNNRKALESNVQLLLIRNDVEFSYAKRKSAKTEH